MKVYRLTKAKYANDLSGTGGLHEGGRWHNEGTRIIYTSAAVSLSMLEVLGHWRKTPVDLVLVTLDIHESANILEVKATDLPTNWRDIPYLQVLRDTGSNWIEAGEFWIMKVPSTHSPSEFNYLLNPLHPEHQTLKLVSVEPHPFDPRLK